MAETMGPPLRVSPTPARAPKTTSKGRKWIRSNALVVALLGIAIVAATTGIAALLIRQDVATTSSATNAVIKFQNGSDYTSINVAGFATLTIPSSASSATMALTGVSGASLTTLGNVLAINNTASSQNYTVTLARSTTLNGAITNFTVTVKDGSTTLVTWNAVSAATSSSYTHVAGRVLNVTVDMVVADGTAAGSLGSFDMQFSFAPV